MATSLISKLELLDLRLNTLLEEIDPKQYQLMVQLHNALQDCYPHMKAWSSIDKALWEGRSIHFNRQTPLHPDSADPVQAWVALVALGEFKKGHLFIPRLNLRLFYEPGTIILFRGHILPHEVEAFEDGQRVSIAYFTHETLWKSAGISI